MIDTENTSSMTGAVLSGASFDDFFNDQYKSVFQEVAWVTGDRAKAADITQDAFYKALLKWNKINRYEKPGAWVRLVALRMAYKKAKPVERLDVLTETPATSHEPSADLQIDVQRALAELSSFYRSLIVLHYFEDMTTVEIADGLKKRDSAIRVALHRAREQLRPLLAESYGS